MHDTSLAFTSGAPQCLPVLKRHLRPELQKLKWEAQWQDGSEQIICLEEKKRQQVERLTLKYAPN